MRTRTLTTFAWFECALSHMIILLHQLTGLLFVLLSIPLAFDVGGPECGVSFTFRLSFLYFVCSTLRLLLRRTRLRYLAELMYNLQVLIVPSLLLLHLSDCHQPTNFTSFDLVKVWNLCLKHATAPFAIFEGFCSLIAVQAFSRVCERFAKKSDAFFYIMIIACSVLISSDIYLLIRIYHFPNVLTFLTATLIGFALAVCLYLGVYAIWSLKGSVVESTLVFSYCVYQIYMTFESFESFIVDHKLLDIQLNKMKLSDKLKGLAKLTPKGIKTMALFVIQASKHITPSILVSLVVRFGVYFVAMRLLPYISNHKRSYMYAYSPILIVMMYTHLLLQHNSQIGDSSVFDFSRIWVNSRQSWQFWGWANVFCLLGLYSFELWVAPRRIRADKPSEARFM